MGTWTPPLAPYRQGQHTSPQLPGCPAGWGSQPGHEAGLRVPCSGCHVQVKDPLWRPLALGPWVPRTDHQGLSPSYQKATMWT